MFFWPRAMESSHCEVSSQNSSVTTLGLSGHSAHAMLCFGLRKSLMRDELATSTRFLPLALAR